MVGNGTVAARDGRPVKVSARSIAGDATGEVTDSVEVALRQIDERLRELQPFVEEYARLEAAAAAAGLAPQHPSHRPWGRPRGSKGTDTRATRAIVVVRARPGITIPELAQEIGVRPNGLYCVLSQLEADGQVRHVRDGRLRRWHPT